MPTTVRCTTMFCGAALLLLGGTAWAEPVPEPAARLHGSAIVVDSHLDVPYALHAKWADLAERGATDHIDVPRMREGGLTAGFFALYVPASYAEKGGAARFTLELSDLVDRVVAASPDLVAARDVAGIRRAKKDGRIAVLKGIEGGHAIENSLGVLRSFHDLGVRYMTLTHTNTNDWADSSGPFWSPDFDPAQSDRHHGLSDFGREVVREMNRLGMAVDVSHVSDATIDDVLETSRAPVFASHSSCRAIAPLPRNLTDAQIRAIGARGGVVMINFGSMFLDPAAIEAFDAYRSKVKDEWTAANAVDPARARAIMDAYEPVRTTLGRAADHVVHALRLAPGGVGLGSDFDGVSDTPVGLDDVSLLPHLTAELLARGLSEEEVVGVLGENFLRFLERVEVTAASLRDEPARTATIDGR